MLKGFGDIKHLILDPILYDFVSMPKPATQRSLACKLLEERGIIRLHEFNAAGITAATVSRMCKDGYITRLARGLYQRLDAPISANHSLAEAAKRQPKGVICLVSALAFHGLTDQLPRAVWMAVGAKDWAPRTGAPPIRVVRFTEAFLAEGVASERIEGVSVNIFNVAKTVADCFRHRRTIGQSVAIEGLREALRQRKATPAEIVRHAERGRVSTVIRPYLEALTADG